MLEPSLQWQIHPTVEVPAWLIQTLQQHVPELAGQFAAQLLWQRGIRDPEQIAGFIDPGAYQPASPFEFGVEMEGAIARLQQARDRQERVAIWGDFDADGITATSVLWEGLGQFFQPHQQLTYYIPNRLTESHGLSFKGIDKLAEQNCDLIVTCDTGSTNPVEVAYAQGRGMDVIVTDHHTLPADRPPVTAIINPRYLPAEHPLAHLSGVAVAYKLLEALYLTLPDVPTRPLEDVLDLVAIGLIADLVQLKGDCRYLAQRGIEKLQQHQNLAQSSRPGIAKLLEFCKRSGDRPTDISFGLGPRINAISRIHGDAQFCVELLTSQDGDRCRELAEATELANSRRKALQRDVAQQVTARLAELDLSTTGVIVLLDPQWSVGVLGLVAGQIARTYGRPTILLSTDAFSVEPEPAEAKPLHLARGSARSVDQIDLYQLVQGQQHLLHSFGGHPLAAGLSIAEENVPLFVDAINRQFREQFSDRLVSSSLAADLTVTVADLGKELFRELKLLEPYGIGNPVPQLLIQNCWFTEIRNRNIQDLRGHKLRYIKTEFQLCDETCDRGFPGLWWEHYRDDLPAGRCDALVELDFNAYQKQYQVRLLAVRPTTQADAVEIPATVDWILDWRNPEFSDGVSKGSSSQNCSASGFSNPEFSNQALSKPAFPDPAFPNENGTILQITRCPGSWDDLQAWFRRALQEGKKLAIAYPPPPDDPPTEIWQRLVGIAKYLSRTGQSATRNQLLEKLEIGDRTLGVGLSSLKPLGFETTSSDAGLSIRWQAPTRALTDLSMAKIAEPFLTAAQEEKFRRQYFYQVPLSTLRAIAQQTALIT